MSMSSNLPFISSNEMASLATGRSASLFESDMSSAREDLEGQINGKRVLVVGGAGSIGSFTVALLTRYQPACIHVVDQNENSLAELVRNLRSKEEGLSISDFRTLPIDYGSQLMNIFIKNESKYDVILNFAALKHVRSEKDSYSILQMIQTNVLKQVSLLKWMSDAGYENYNYFSVSTDKAANPVNLMGASKRIMEHVIFSDELIPNFKACVTSARFANVAFSDGSLLQSFINRLQKRQPLAVPKSTWRYFISLEEAAQICLLAAFCAPSGSIIIPWLDEKEDALEISAISERVLNHFGFNASFYEKEEEAMRSMEFDISRGRYPVLLTSLDTSGEKSCEEFVGEGEDTHEIGFKKLIAVCYKPHQRGALGRFVKNIDEVMKCDVRIGKSDLVALISGVIPEFKHIETGKNLDERM